MRIFAARFGKRYGTVYWNRLSEAKADESGERELPFGNDRLTVEVQRRDRSK